MERKVVRINGVKERLSNWNIEELIACAGHLEDKIHKISGELSLIYAEIERQYPEWFTENAVNGDSVDE